MSFEIPGVPLRKPVLPGSTIGILGGGQLGRLFALTARRMGYGVVVFSTEANSPAGVVADREIVGAYTDPECMAIFANTCDVITLEFENIPLAAANALSDLTPVFPQPHILDIAQNRLREKAFLKRLDLPLTPYYPIEAETDFATLPKSFQFPAVLKTADSGYDGKGQQRVTSLSEAMTVFKSWNEPPCVLEQWVSDLACEISVIAARSQDGAFAAYRPSENQHVDHILDVTLVPAGVSAAIEAEALRLTQHLVDGLKLQGLLCVEFFVTGNGQLLVNEIAPRPHNSGHYTIEAADCSQYEQQLRAVCALPLGSTALKRPTAAMANLLGDLWDDGEPDWSACLTDDVALHLYGKALAKPKRKMGHLTALGDTAEQALQKVLVARNSLKH